MTIRRKFEMLPYDEEQAQRIADIVGPSSAAAKALAQLQRRRSDGEDVYLWIVENAILVGPVPRIVPENGSYSG
jgi:hypothetical protein